MERYFTLVLVALAATRAWADGIGDCNVLENPDRQIRSCMLVMERGQEGAKKDAATAYINRGEVYLANRDVDRAIDDFTQAIALNPTSAEAHAARARAYYLKLDIDAAVADSKKVIEIASKYDAAYTDWSISYSGEGNRE